MPLKNYTTNIKVNKTIGDITAILVKHKARAILTEYSENGETIGISFKIITKQGEQGVKLPVRVDGVLKVLTDQKKNNARRTVKIIATKEQAYMVGWRNIKDWLDAQMALLECEMVEMEEIFLPYTVTKTGQTVFESIKNNSLLLE